ncbi:MAG: DUF3006 domain-containing protein [Gemmatimonadaceae bacterium]
MAREQQRKTGDGQRSAAGTGSGEPSRPSHRWAIDRVEEGTAAVEQDGDHVYEIPRYLLPPDARDGDVLTVMVTGAAAGEVTLSVRIDRAAADAPRKAARKRRAGNDRGGDIVL